jgi:hypothetical protein
VARSVTATLGLSEIHACGDRAALQQIEYRLVSHPEA